MNLHHCDRCGAQESAFIALEPMKQLVGGYVLKGPWFCVDRKACTARRLAQNPPTFEDKHRSVIAARQLRLVR